MNPAHKLMRVLPANRPAPHPPTNRSAHHRPSCGGLRPTTDGRRWRSSGRARSHPARDRRNGSPERSASTRSTARPSRRASRWPWSPSSPGPATAWHTHPLGQTLIVTSGCGWVQREGGPVEEIRPGDIVAFPPGEKHWHGATSTTAMTHIAIQERLNGKAVDWMEKVSDEEYRK